MGYSEEAVVIKKLAAVLALALTSYIVAPALVAPAQAADDPYTAGVPTSCNLNVPAVVRVGTAPSIRIHVQPNGPAGGERPTGDVTVSISKAGTGIFSKTVAYNGSAVTIQGPVITQPGRYQVNGKFKTADGSVFKSCSSVTAFDVSAGQNPDDPGGPGGPGGPGPDGGTTDPDGILPDTGGPNLLWLLLALVLLGGGGGLVYAARRGPRAPLYDV
jgi:hypothetical protein